LDRLPLLEKLIAIEAGIHQDVVAFASDQPYHHRQIHLARGICARNKSGYRKVADRRIPNRADLVLRTGGGGLRESKCSKQDKEELDLHSHRNHPRLAVELPTLALYHFDRQLLY